MPKKACFRKADDRSFYRANARSQKKLRFFWLGTAKSAASSRAVQAKAGKREKPERKQRLFGLGNGEGCTVEQSRAGECRKQRRRNRSRVGQRPPIFMMCCDGILFPILRSSFFCHMEAMKVYISGQSAVGTEDPAFIAEGIHDLMNGGDDFLIGSVHQHTVTVIETA